MDTSSSHAGSGPRRERTGTARLQLSSGQCGAAALRVARNFEETTDGTQIEFNDQGSDAGNDGGGLGSGLRGGCQSGGRCASGQVPGQTAEFLREIGRAHV